MLFFQLAKLPFIRLKSMYVYIVSSEQKDADQIACLRKLVSTFFVHI